MDKYKDRVVDYNVPVQIYRNLTSKTYKYSVRQHGKVVAHTNTFCLKNVRFIVNEKQRQWVLRNRRKIVHAYIEGTISDFSGIRMIPTYDVYYEPYSCSKFKKVLDGLKFNIETANFCYTQDGRILVQI